MTEQTEVLIRPIEISERGCGKRKPGGLYLVAPDESKGNPWFPRHVRSECAGCGLVGAKALRPSRNIQEFYPGQLFTELETGAPPMRWITYALRNNIEAERPWVTFLRSEKHYVITVGEQFYPTPEDFLKEAETQGFSRLIRALPRGFVPGETRIFIMHPKAVVETNEAQTIDQLFAALKDKVKAPGIIAAFIPKEVQYVVRGDESNEELEAMVAKGITPVSVSYK